jgi:hypothetical protein
MGCSSYKHRTWFVTRTSATGINLCLLVYSIDHCFGCRAENSVSCVGGLKLPSVTVYGITLTQIATIYIYILFMALFLFSLEFSLASHNQYFPHIVYVVYIVF